MEIGKSGELTILTPGERRWIELAIGDNAMAHKMLGQGAGRQLECNRGESDGSKPCGQAAAFYAVVNDGSLLTFCEEHWKKDGDPHAMFPLG